MEDTKEFSICRDDVCKNVNDKNEDLWPMMMKIQPDFMMIVQDENEAMLYVTN